MHVSAMVGTRSMLMLRTVLVRRRREDVLVPVIAPRLRPIVVVGGIGGRFVVNRSVAHYTQRGL